MIVTALLLKKEDNMTPERLETLIDEALEIMGGDTDTIFLTAYPKGCSCGSCYESRNTSEFANILSILLEKEVA